MTTGNGDPCPVGVSLLGSDLADHADMRDVFAAVAGDVIEMDESEGVSSFHSLLIVVSFRAIAYALAQASKLVCNRLVPCHSEFGMPAELAMFESRPSIGIGDRQCPG